ncbi:hypothetical protein [Crocosphaera sp.]|uniref:hypothetical protein n=1 Tax=Crocosphaera sp. TaxID=2729996 RepID=UPI003F205405|nr:hypothetical protein [Crocosphaera sp.]
MTRLITKKIMILGLAISLLTIKPILAHSGHDHSKPETKSPKIEQEKNKILERKQPQTAETQPINVTLQQSNQFNLIPQPSEIIFFLLIANPIILKIIRQKLHQS